MIQLSWFVFWLVNFLYHKGTLSPCGIILTIRLTQASSPCTLQYIYTKRVAQGKYIYSVFLKTYMIQVTVINLLEGLHNIMYTEFFEQ
jgi:hypothetical protein